MKKLRQWGVSGTAFSFSVAVLGIAVAVFSATQLGFGSKAEVGSGAFPFLVGIMLAVTGFYSGIDSVRHGKNKTGDQAEGAPGRGSARRVGYTVVAYLIWLLLTPHLGYLPTTFVVTMAMAKIAGLEGWFRPTALSLTVTFFVYLLFEVLFYVDLPRGILE